MRFAFASIISAVFFTSASAQTVPGPMPNYALVKNCLEKVSVAYNGTTYYLQEGIHFRNGAGHPEFVAAVHVQLVAGLMDTAPWNSQQAAIKACLDQIPGLAFRRRTDN